jgi:2-polyprenyl-3-methyl-5-hydroxy-6-metoxy-1,4-benzoquinol methylase
MLFVRPSLEERLPGSSAVQTQSPPCPACGGSAFRKIFTKKGYHFWKCVDCGLERRHPLPTLEDLKTYYDSSYVHGLYREFIVATQMKRATAERRFREIESSAQGGRWLDVGCSNGVFVELLRARGLDAHGIELSEVPVAEARARGLPVERSALEDYRPEAPFDVITCFDLLEHAIDPIVSLEALHRLLAPGGTLVVTAPNQGSTIRRVMGPSWYFYIPEEHLHYFNRSTMRRLLTRVGFDVIRLGRTLKPLSLRYSLAQLAEYTPALHRLLQGLAQAVPDALLDRVLPLYIGEMIAIARRREPS